MIVVHAAFPIDPDRRQEALEYAKRLVMESNLEDGTIEYRAATDVQDPTVLRFVERYEDADAFEAHTETAHFKGFEEGAPMFLDGEPEIRRFEVTDATEIEL